MHEQERRTRPDRGLEDQIEGRRADEDVPRLGLDAEPEARNATPWQDALDHFQVVAQDVLKGTLFYTALGFRKKF